MPVACLLDCLGVCACVRAFRRTSPSPLVVCLLLMCVLVALLLHSVFLCLSVFCVCLALSLSLSLCLPLSVSLSLALCPSLVSAGSPVDWPAAFKLSSHFFSSSSSAVLDACDGVLVPGGFGVRGVEGKLKAVRYAREQKKPFLGVCLGMQCAVIEVARSLVGLAGANSTEFDEDTPHPVVILMPETSTTHMGGTMRLGARETRFADTSGLAAQLYGGRESVMERHRHR